MTRRGRPSTADLVLAGVLAALVVGEGVAYGASIPEILLSAAPAVLLAWRRPAPLLTPSVLFVVAVHVARGGDPDAFETIGQILVWVVATYSAGAVLTRRWAVGALGYWWLLAGVWVWAQRDGGVDLLFELVLVTAPWVAGVVSRGLRERADRSARDAAEQARRADRAAESAAAEERIRIARELHDVVAHGLGVMVVQAGAAAELLERDPARARQALGVVVTSGQGAVDELGRMLGLLRMPDQGRAPLPSLSRLDALVEEARSTGTEVRLAVDGDLATVPAAVDASAYRIVQEALTNATKHAPGSVVDVTVRVAGGGVSLDVVNDLGATPGTHADQGAGAAAGIGTGFGLVGIRERVAAFGGDLTVGALDGRFALRATLPLTADAGPGTDRVGADRVGADRVGADGVGASGVGVDEDSEVPT